MNLNFQFKMINEEFIEEFFEFYQSLLLFIKKNTLQKFNEGKYNDQKIEDFLMEPITLSGKIFLSYHNSFNLKKSIEYNENTSISINETFNYEKYGNFKIIRNIETSYVNASNLIINATNYENSIRAKLKAKLIPLKEIDQWFRLEETKLLLQTISLELNVETESLKHKKLGRQKTGFEELKGIYIHPLLVNSVCIWVSPSYAIKVNKIMNQLNINAQLCEARETILKKDRTIINQSKEIDRLLKKLDDFISNLGNTVNKLGSVTGYVQNVAKSIQITTSLKNKHYIAVAKVKLLEIDDFIYKCFRLHYDNVNSTLNLEEKNNYFYKLILFEPCVNPIQVWKEFKFNRKIICKCNNFTIKKGYLEESVMNDIKVLLKERINEINEII